MMQRRPDRVTGSCHDAFWGWCDQGELRLQRCSTCTRLFWPPVQACGQCQGQALRWERMSGRGQIVSWCSFARDYYSGTLPLPWDTILVELEEGPLFISNPEGFGRQEIERDMKVQVSFLDCEDGAGPFRLPVFVRRPDEPGHV